MSDIVVNSSVVAKWVLAEADSSEALDLFAEAHTNGDRLVVIDLVFPEVGNAICTKHRRGLISADEARGCLRDLLRCPVHIEPVMPLLGRALEIGLQYGRALYDALFVALSESLDAEAVTADEPLYNKEVRLVSTQHTSQIKYEGRLYSVEVPRLRVRRCGACGELVFDNDADEQIALAFRQQLGILLGDQIRKNREELDLSQRSLAEHLGVAVETISRWENGALTQSRAMDRYLRVYFGVPAARAALVGQFGPTRLGTHVEM